MLSGPMKIFSILEPYRKSFKINFVNNYYILLIVCIYFDYFATNEFSRIFIFVQMSNMIRERPSPDPLPNLYWKLTR